MPKRYTSGQFAKLCHTTKETLFHYDELGLLRPQHVGENGYRYYDSKQFLQFEMICFLKETGMPLREIGAFLRQKGQEDTIAVLKEKASALRRERERLVQQENFVQALLNIASESETIPFDQLVLRTLGKTSWELSDTFGELDTTEGISLASARFLEGYRAEARYPGLPTGFFFAREDFCACALGRGKIFAPVTSATLPSRQYTSPAGLFAILAHQGTWPKQVEALRSIPDLLRREGLTITGPVLVFDMGSYWFTDHFDNFIFHCHIPVSRAPS